MQGPVTIWEQLWAWVAAVPIVGAALWGALGGWTNALVVQVTLRAAIRLIAIGALVAAGVGSAGGYLLEAWSILPEGTTSAAGGALGGSVAYLMGSLGAACFEVLLRRIRAAGPRSKQ